MLEETKSSLEVSRPFFDKEAFEAIGHDEKGAPVLEKVTPRHLNEPMAIDGDTLLRAFDKQIYQTSPSVQAPKRLEAFVLYPDPQFVLYLDIDGRTVHRYVLVRNQFGTAVNIANDQSVRAYYDDLKGDQEIYFAIQEGAQASDRRIHELQSVSEKDARVEQGAEIRQEKDRIVSLIDDCRKARSEYESKHGSAAHRHRFGHGILRSTLH